MEQAAKPENASGVKFLLAEAKPEMLSTLQRNVDADVSDQPHLKHAPVSSSHVESLFGSVDHALHSLPGVSMHAAFGVASAIQSGVFRTGVENAERERVKNYGGRTTRSSRMLCLDGDATEDNLNSFQMYKQVPKEDREALLRYLLSRKGFRDSIQLPQHKQETAQIEASRKRKQATSDAVDRSAGRKALLYHAIKKAVEWIKNVQTLTVRLAAVVTDKVKVEILQNQVRYRQHVLGIAKRKLPLIGGKGGAAENLLRLRPLVEAMIRDEPATQAMPAPPSALATRTAPAVMTDRRKQLDDVRAQLVEEANLELTKLTVDRTANVPVGMDLPPLLSEEIQVSAVGMPRRQAMRTVAVETGAAAEAARALEGQSLRMGRRMPGVAETVNYKVLSAFWSLLDDTPLVLFYNTGEHSDADEGAMLEDPSAFLHAHVCKADLVAQWLEKARER